jgi:hypothetical protein
MEPEMHNSIANRSRYSVAMESGLPSFLHGQFNSINVGTGGEPWSGFNADHTGTNFHFTNGTESMINANFANLPATPLAQTLVRSPDTGSQNLAGLGDWQQYPDSTNIRYDFGQ